MTRLLACALAVSACTGGPMTMVAAVDASTDAAETAMDSATAMPESSDAAGPVTHEIVVGAAAFSPFVTIVAPGDSVLFRWGTTVPTSVTSGFLCLGDGMFSSPALRSPTTWRLTFVGRGPYPFMAMERCEQETGIIVVE